VAKLFRVWEKKRGDRRTGSRLAGTVGEAAFFGSLFVLGVVSLATLLTSQAVAPDPDFFTLGLGAWLVLIVLSSLILIGGAGFLLTVLEIGASAERRSALVRRAGDIELIREVRQRGREYPTIPRDTNLINSPGVRLKYRLPGLESPGWTLAAAAVTCLLCVGTAILLIVLAVHGFQSRPYPWALVAFLIPFSSVTVWSVYYFIRQLLIHTGIGPTSVEISNHPLFPGQSLDVFLAQSGRLKVKQLTVELACEEEVSFRQGTDIRSERRVVYRDVFATRENFEIEPAIPFEMEGTFRVPDAAMHSFRSSHNAIHWKLIVRGDFDDWPLCVRGFPVIVYPAVSSEESPNGPSD
jgi:hypothetical protein